VLDADLLKGHINKHKKACAQPGNRCKTEAVILDLVACRVRQISNKMCTNELGA
jgi:hypothetical protein